MSENYSVYSKFDLKKHKATFVNYLEVIIGPDGVVQYAVPSHQEMLIKIACVKLGITRQELNDMCPQQWYFDFVRWLCKITGCISVWNEFVIGYEFNAKHIETLRRLKTDGVYRGDIPEETK